MTTTTVNGTSLQAAIDKAQPGDTLALAAGGYAAAKVTKALEIRSDGGAQVSGAGTGANGAALLIEADGVTLDGLVIPEADCYGLRLYQHNGLQARNLKIQNAAAGVEVHRGGAGSLFQDVDISDISKMVSDVDGGANGGDAYQLYNTTGPIAIKGGTLERLRARSAWAAAHWGSPVDGGAYNIFGGTSDVTIEDQVIRDAVNLTETGKNPADGNPTRVTFRRVAFFGNNSSDPAQISSGAFIRVGVDFLFDSCEFHQPDWNAFMLVTGGGFAGTVSGFQFVDNRIWLSAQEAYRIDLPNDVIKLIDGNQVYLGTQSRVAEVHGQATSSLDQFRAWTGQPAPAEYWGPEPAIDPCADVKLQLAQATATLAATTSERDAYAGAIDQAAAQLAVEDGLKTATVHRLRTIINNAQATLAAAR